MDEDVKHERELREQWQKSHIIIHEQEQRANETAAMDINRRLEQMNAFRQQINDERGLYLSRELYDREHRALSEAHDARLKILETAKVNCETLAVRLDDVFKQVQDLRESRSEGGGERRAISIMQSNKQWTIGLAILVLFNILGLIIGVIGFFVHSSKQ